ncbi:MAG: SUMF1/EgtB/PvdO family nonheme iron enzyme, partial [Candidatus Eremiobacterota bacterium]
NYVYKFYSPEEFSNKNNISYFLPHKFTPENIDFLKEIIIDFYFSGRYKIFSEVNGYCLTEDNAAGNPYRPVKLSADVTEDERTIIKTKKFGVYAIGTVRESATPVVPEMILISSSHRHIKSFYMARHEVTYKEYYRYCKVYSDVEQPAVHISWYDAIKYCNWLTLNTPGFTEEDCCYSGIPPDIRTDRYKKGYRLPSEDEWKYVLSKEPKSLGLYDIKLEPFMRCSQVYQWADNDRYYRYWTYNISGGCWGTFEPDDDRWYNIGFRLARTADT